MRSLLKKMDKALISFAKSCKGKFAMSRAPSPEREARALPEKINTPSSVPA